MDASDALEARERTCELRFANTTHYHIDFDLNIGLTDNQLDFLKTHVSSRDDINAVTFQASKDCAEVSMSNGMYIPSSRVLSLKEQIENTKISIKKIQNIIGTSRDIGIENNNFYPTGAYKISTSLEFLLSILEFNNLDLLLDIAHALVTCANSSYEYQEYIEKLLATGKCNQLHLCQPTYKYTLDGISAKDSHEIPSMELTESTIFLAKKWNINNLTIEYYKDSQTLVSYLKYLKSTYKF